MCTNGGGEASRPRVRPGNTEAEIRSAEAGPSPHPWLRQQIRILIVGRNTMRGATSHATISYQKSRLVRNPTASWAGIIH